MKDLATPLQALLKVGRSPGDNHNLLHIQIVGGVGASIAEFMGIFAVTQIPLAIAEGLLTVVVFNVLEKYSRTELQELRVL